MNKPTKPILLIYVNNHFDPIWRRCWDRRFTFKGDTFISYAEIEAYYMLDNLELAHQNPEYKFEAESSLVVQKFLEFYPDRLEELRQLSQSGRFGITGGGQVIVDTNLILGESIVRNYLIGLKYVEDNFGQKTRLAVRNDGFGNSAQLPQILRGVEIEWATGMSYSLAEGIYWRGLDGSVIVHAELPSGAQGGGATKYAPCPACRGAGQDASGGLCAVCHGRGIEPRLKARLPEQVDREAFTDPGPAVGGSALRVAALKMGPEELLPNPELPAWARSLAPEIEARFALEEEALPYLQAWFDRIGNPPEELVHPRVELNPNNTGVYLTRIRTKQNVRRQEYAMATTELLAVMAALKGHAYPRQQMDAVWKTLLFTMFHDSITATHVDPAYEEIQAMWREIDAGLDGLRADTLPVLMTPLPGCISVLNPTGHPTSQPVRVKLPVVAGGAGLVDDRGQPVACYAPKDQDSGVLEFIAKDVPAFSSRFYNLTGGGSPVISSPTALAGNSIENQRFSIQADEQGLLSIWDKTLMLDVAKAGEYRPGELILEHDEGSPWATLHPDQSRTPLAGYTQLVAVEKTPICQRMTFEINSPFRAGYVSVGLKAKMNVTLWEGIERVDFNLWVDWNTFNHRLRVAMPVPGTGRSIYGIPYGMLERQPYQPDFHWYAANGDWPAVNWAGVETQAFSLALHNKGLPSYRIEPGKNQGQVMLLSVLRSPAIPTYLHEPEYYTMTEWDGMRDSGEHTFEFAITAYPERLSESSVVLDAESYNAGLLPLAGKLNPATLPGLFSDNCRIASIKWAEQGQAVALRLVEYRGMDGEARLTLPGIFKVVEATNLLERQGRPLVVENGQVVVHLRPWEIATLHLGL